MNKRFWLILFSQIVWLFDGGSGAQAQDRIHIIIRAFIPNSLDQDTGYIKPIPGRTNQFMIQPPLGSGFATDHRTFSSNFSASARVVTEFVLVVNGDKASVEKVANRPYHSCGSTESITLVNGKITGTDTKTASMSVDALGKPMFANGMAQIAGQAAAANPFLPSPWVDYSFDIMYKPGTKQLSIKANVGAFPAFEGYAKLNSGSAVSLFKAKPTVGGVRGLWDGGTGITDRRLENSVTLTP